MMLEIEIEDDSLEWCLQNIFSLHCMQCDVSWSVCLCIYLLGTPVSPAEMDEPITMPLG